LGALKAPVLLYVTALTTMAWLAFGRKGSSPRNSYQLVATGASLFMLSDSILAINKFYSEIIVVDVWVMTTYAAAQFCIVLGLIRAEST